MGMEFHESDCLIPTSEFFIDKFRSPVNCSECANVKGVKRLRNLSPVSFIIQFLNPIKQN